MTGIGMEQTRSCEHGFPEGGGLIPPPERLRKVLIVGAGVAGLQTARQLLRLGAQVLVLEANDEVGGVWIRNYIGFGLQVPWRMYEFPEFPWPKDIKPTSEYPTGQEVQEYVQAYCREYDLRRYIRFNCKLLRLRWCPGTRQWDALYCDTLQEKFFKVSVDYTVICAGIYSQPYIPDYEGTDSYAGIQLHAKDFVDLSLARGRRVVIVGAGKTALDCVSSIVATNTATSVTLLYRQAHWPLPRRMLGTSVRRLLFNRAMTAMMPPYYTAGKAATTGDKLASPLKKLFWRGMESLISRKFRITEQMRPRVHLPADLFYGGQILDNTMDKLVRGEALVTIKGEINRFVRNGVILQDGNFVAADLVLYCTGYLKTYEYLEGDMRTRLDLQKDGLYLYRNCLPYAVPHLAFIGSEVSTYNNILTHGLQALWLAHVLSGRLQLPPPSVMVEDVRAQQRWRRSIMPAQRSRGSVLMLYMMQYHDQLLSDMGAPPRRKGLNVVAECFGAYTAFDYRNLVIRDETVLAAKEAEEQLAAAGVPPAVLAATASGRNGHMAASAMTNTHYPPQQLPNATTGAGGGAAPAPNGRIMPAPDGVMYGGVAPGAMMAAGGAVGGGAVGGIGGGTTSRRSGCMGSAPGAEYRRVGSARGAGPVGAFSSLRAPHGEAEQETRSGHTLQGGTGLTHSPRTAVAAANINGGGVASGGGVAWVGASGRPSLRAAAYAPGMGLGSSCRTMEDIETEPACPSASASARRKLHRNLSAAVSATSTGTSASMEGSFRWAASSEQHLRSPRRLAAHHVQHSLDVATAAAAVGGLPRYGRRHNSSRAALGGVMSSSSSGGAGVTTVVAARSRSGSTPIARRTIRPPALEIPMQPAAGATEASSPRPALERKSSSHAQPASPSTVVPGRSSSQVWRGTGQASSQSANMSGVVGSPPTPPLAAASTGCSNGVSGSGGGSSGRGNGNGALPNSHSDRPRGPNVVCRSSTARGARDASASGSFAAAPSSPSRLSRHTGPESPLSQRSQRSLQQQQLQQQLQQHSPRPQPHAVQSLVMQNSQAGPQPQSQCQCLGAGGGAEEEQHLSEKFAFVSADHMMRGSGDDTVAWLSGKLPMHWRPDSQSAPSTTRGRCQVEGSPGGGGRKAGCCTAGADGGSGGAWVGGCSCSTSEEDAAWCAAQPASSTTGTATRRAGCFCACSGPHVGMLIDSAGEDEAPSSSCNRTAGGTTSGAEASSGEGACTCSGLQMVPTHGYHQSRSSTASIGAPAGVANLTDREGSSEEGMTSRCRGPGGGSGGGGSWDRICPRVAVGPRHSSDMGQGRVTNGKVESVEGPGRMAGVDSGGCSRLGSGGPADGTRMIAGDSACWLSMTPQRQQLPSAQPQHQHHQEGQQHQQQHLLRTEPLGAAGSDLAGAAPLLRQPTAADDVLAPPSLTSPQTLPRHEQHLQHPQTQPNQQHPLHQPYHPLQLPHPFQYPHPLQHPHHQQRHSPTSEALLRAAISAEPRVASLLTSLVGAVSDNPSGQASPNSSMSLSQWQVTFKGPGTRRSSMGLDPLVEEDDGARGMLVAEHISLTGMTATEVDGDVNVGGGGAAVGVGEGVRPHVVAAWPPLRSPVGPHTVPVAVPVPTAQHEQQHKQWGATVMETERGAVGGESGKPGNRGMEPACVPEAERGPAGNVDAKRGAGASGRDEDGSGGDDGGEEVGTVVPSVMPGSGRGGVGRPVSSSLEGGRGDGGGSDAELDDSAAPLRRGSDALAFSWTASGGMTSSSLTSSAALRDWRRVVTGVQTSVDVGWTQNLAGSRSNAGSNAGGDGGDGGGGGDTTTTCCLGSSGPSISNCSTGSSGTHMNSSISLANGLGMASSGHSGSRASAFPALLLGPPLRQHSMSRLSRSATNEGSAPPAALEAYAVSSTGERNPRVGMVMNGGVNLGPVELPMFVSSPTVGSCKEMPTAMVIAERMPQSTATSCVEVSPFSSPSAFALSLGSQVL